MASKDKAAVGMRFIAAVIEEKVNPKALFLLVEKVRLTISPTFKSVWVVSLMWFFWVGIIIPWQR